MMKSLIPALVLLTCLGGVLTGCSSDDSMTGTVKANPAMANRFKQPTSSGGSPMSAAPSNAPSGRSAK